LPVARAFGELPTLRRDADLLRTFRTAVDKLDLLTVKLREGDLLDTAASVQALADAIDALADVIDSRASEISADFLLEHLRDQTRAVKKVNRAIRAAVAAMGRC
jgi:hypothetical protein